jgi:hypothetical protein
MSGQRISGRYRHYCDWQCLTQVFDIATKAGLTYVNVMQCGLNKMIPNIQASVNKTPVGGLHSGKKFVRLKTQFRLVKSVFLLSKLLSFT